uniref:Large ribosomal subunit protein uL23c n=1 Tax=Lobochlamys culleus TaxID=51693 RepID=A0A0S2IDC8_9CHLO|nr:ribosomal protein L23 [Lobochlamys culleus]
MSENTKNSTKNEKAGYDISGKLVAQQNSATFARYKNLISTNSVNSMADLIKYPVITQKTYFGLVKNRQYTFDVDPRLTKPQIKKLFEKLFNVTIISINTHIPPRHKLRVGFSQGYRPLYKRIIITLKEEQFINFEY